ncbi:MAG: IS200/IS605 family transposase [bacterium]
MKTEKKSSHNAYNIYYHITFCPKYRHRVIEGRLETALKHIINNICITYSFNLIEIECMPDHIHIFLSASPSYSPAKIVRILKSISARKIFYIFPQLKEQKFWGSGLWSRGYYVETIGSTTKDNIRKYIQRQKEKGQFNHLPQR